jgi:hypothetical protein
MPAVDLLKRTLYWEAGLLAAGGLFAALFPAWLLQTLFAQPPEPLPWVRIAGVQALGFAMLAVVLARRLEQLWWACWAYVVTSAGIAVVTAGHALFGLPDGVSPVLWWLMAVESVALVAALLIGLAKAGTERDPNSPVED